MTHSPQDIPETLQYLVSKHQDNFLQACQERSIDINLTDQQQSELNEHPQEITTNYNSTQEIDTHQISSENREDLPEEDAILLALDALDNM